MSVKRFAVDCISGAVSGLFATAPMTAAMKLQHKILPAHLKQRLPPRKLTMRIVKRLGIKTSLIRPKKKYWMTVASHYGYGALTGMAYPVLEKTWNAPPVLKGSLYGLFIWFASYRGWLPVAGLWSPKIESKRRARLMIASHIVWGGFLGALTRPVQNRILMQQSKKIFR